MSLPALYFRLRDNGAQVFRVDTENRQGRLELDPLAIANTRNGEIRVQGDRSLTDDERSQIEAWIAARQASLADDEAALPSRTIAALNAAAQWVQSRATDAQINAEAEALLLAMHDLRSQIVRRQADALDEADTGKNTD